MITQSSYSLHAQLSKSHVCRLTHRGMPLSSFEDADTWRRTRARAPLKPPPAISRPAAAAEGVDRAKVAEDGPEGAYERQKAAERAAYVLAAGAIKAGSPDAARLVALHALTARNLTDGREEVLRLRELERSLVSGAWVRAVMTNHDGAAVTLIRAMPKQLSGRICPHDPEFAENELSRWVDEVFLRTLSETDPWKETKE